MLEVLAGIVFVLFAISIKLSIFNITVSSIIYFALYVLYITSLFIIGGIDKENINIQRSVLIFALLTASCYMTYVCIHNKEAVYTYIIYLMITILLLFADIIYTKKRQKQSYIIGCLMLILYMLVFSDSKIMYFTIVLSILCIVVKALFKLLKNKKKSNNQKKKDEKNPIGFYLCISNILLIILFNFLTI